MGATGGRLQQFVQCEVGAEYLIRGLNVVFGRLFVA